MIRKFNLATIDKSDEELTRTYLDSELQADGTDDMFVSSGRKERRDGPGA